MADGALEDIQATLASVAPAILLIKGINDSNGTAANAELVQKAQLVVNRVVLKLQASALAVDQSGRLSSRLWTIAGDDMTGVPNEEVWTLPVVVTDMDRDVLLSALENMSTLRTVFAGKRKAELDVDGEVAMVNNIKNSFGLAEGGDGVNDDLLARHVSETWHRPCGDAEEQGLEDGGGLHRYGQADRCFGCLRFG
jgi:hypothetical protein